MSNEIFTSPRFFAENSSYHDCPAFLTGFRRLRD